MGNKLGKIGTAAALVGALNAGTGVDAKANDVDLTTDQTKFAASKAIQDDSVKDLSQLDRYVKFNGTDGGYGTGDTIGLSTLDGLTGIEYSDLYGPIVNVGLQINKEDGTQSFLLQGSYSKGGSDKKSEKRLLAGYGYKVSDNSVITFLGERLIQEKDYLSELWGDPKAYNYDATQDKLGLNFRLHSFDFKGYYSKSYDKKLENREIIIDSTDFWQQYGVTTKFKGQEAYGANIGSKFDLTDNIDLETAIGTSVVDGESFVDGGAKVNVHMGHKGYVYLDVHTTGDINTGSVGYEGNVFDTGATWTASASYTEGPNDHEETRGSLMLNIPLGKRSKKNYKKPSYDSLDNVSNTVRYDVRDFKSSVVRGEVVEEQKLISEVDKNALPAGSTVDSETGNITVPGLSANATSFESITRDGNTISDNGAFAISGGNLTINLDKLEEPEGEDDIYKLLTNGNPQNEITVHVIKGSKKVVSVSVKTLDTISTIGAPTLESKTDTTINAKAGTFDDADGVEGVTVVLYSDAELTKFVASRVDGDFTGLDQNTTYYVVTEGKAKNASTGEMETKRSSVLEVTTDITDGTTTIGIPTLESKTDTTINTTPGNFIDSDGVKKIEVELYSDAGLTERLGYSTDGNFHGLKENTTYYVVTKGEALNATTGKYEIKRGNALEITTDSADQPTTIGAPTLESKTDTTINTAPGTFTDADGVEGVTVVLYRDAGLTNFVASRVDGDFTGLTHNTTYYAVTEGKAKNETTGEMETKRSNSITIITETTVIPDAPTTALAPTLQSRTDTIINVKAGNFTDANGEQNVEVELYSDSGLTNLVATEANGYFTGLNPSSTYYAVTKGEAKNATTGAWEIKRSGYLAVSTEATPPPNTAPTANNDSTTTPHNTSVLYDVLANDTDVESGVTLTGSITNQVGGTFVVEAGQIRFTPTPGSSGQASCTYEIEDAQGATDIATLIVIVQVAPNTDPTATNATNNAGGETATYDLAGNIADAESPDANLTISVESGPSHGSLVWNTNTQFTYTVTQGSFYAGDDSFTYKVTDPQGGESQVRTVTITGVIDF